MPMLQYLGSAPAPVAPSPKNTAILAAYHMEPPVIPSTITIAGGVAPMPAGAGFFFIVCGPPPRAWGRPTAWVAVVGACGDSMRYRSNIVISRWHGRRRGRTAKILEHWHACPQPRVPRPSVRCAVPRCRVRLAVLTHSMQISLDFSK